MDALDQISQRSEFSIRANNGQVLQGSRIRLFICAAAEVLRIHGVRFADHIVFRGDQSLDAFVWFWASVSIGAIFVPVDRETTLHQYRWVCSRLNPKLTVSEVDERDTVMHPIGIGPPSLASSCYQEVSVSSMQSSIMSTAGSATAACLLTSGSTGEPKIVMLGRDALASSAARVFKHFGWQPQERLLNLPPPHTMSGLRNAFIAVPLIGMQWIASSRRSRASLADLLELIKSTQAERIVAAPMLIRQINLHGDRSPRDLFEYTQALYCTGAELSSAEVEVFYAKYARPIVNYYGLTETVGLCITQRVEAWDPKDRSVGRPADCDVRLVDGELWIRQRNPMSGYFDDPVGTAAAFHDGWLRSGDSAHFDDGGRLYITGRLGTFIKTIETEKVSPVEVEAVLERHCNVSEAAVCGLSDRAGGERIAALLVVKGAEVSKALQRDIREWVAKHLGDARVPSVIRWSAAVPRTENGKIQRSRLAGYFDD